MGEVNLITCNNFDFILLFEHGICIFLSVVMVRIRLCVWKLFAKT